MHNVWSALEEPMALEFVLEGSPFLSHLLYVDKMATACMLS